MPITKKRKDKFIYPIQGLLNKEQLDWFNKQKGNRNNAEAIRWMLEEVKGHFERTGE